MYFYKKYLTDNQKDIIYFIEYYQKIKKNENFVKWIKKMCIFAMIIWILAVNLNSEILSIYDIEYET